MAVVMAVVMALALAIGFKERRAMIDKYLDYVKGLGDNGKVQGWINSNLKNYLAKEFEDQTEIEHILDYLLSDVSPQRLVRMSYKQAKKKAEEWNNTLIKKGENINETEGDVEIIRDFGDGFKIVKLIGENAFKREGYLMRHCVASYYGTPTEIYSLRDKNNIPHCTMEKNNQIKGKGNGSISPKYINYIVNFLQATGMRVGDNEMKNLGYLNMSRFKDKLCKDTKFVNEKYIHEDDKLVGIDGEEFLSLDLLDVKPLIKTTQTSLKTNYNLADLVSSSIRYMKLGDYSAQNASCGDFAQNASCGDFAQNASCGDYAKNASCGDYAKNASCGYSAKNASSGDLAQNASSGDYAQNASCGYSAQNASGGDYAKNASSGDSAQNASCGDSAQNASCGDFAQNASCGDLAQNASSGDYAQNASCGDYAQNASCGDYAKNHITGKNSVCVCAGKNSIINGVIGTWFALTEYDSEGKCIMVKSGMIDGEILKENVWYGIKNGEFIEVNND